MHRDSHPCTCQALVDRCGKGEDASYVKELKAAMIKLYILNMNRKLHLAMKGTERFVYHFVGVKFEVCRITIKLHCCVVATT